MAGYRCSLLALLKREEMHYSADGCFEDAGDLVRLMVDVRPTQMVMLAHQYVQCSESEALRGEGGLPDDALDSVRTILVSGAAVPAACSEPYARAMRNLKDQISMYGQQELGLVALHQVDSDKLGTVLPGCKVKVRRRLPGEGRGGIEQLGAISSVQA